MSVIEPFGKASFGLILLFLPRGSERLGMFVKCLEADLSERRRVITAKAAYFESFQDYLQFKSMFIKHFSCHFEMY